jgi:hypothetical protein
MLGLRQSLPDLLDQLYELSRQGARNLVSPTSILFGEYSSSLLHHILKSVHNSPVLEVTSQNQEIKKYVKLLWQIAAGPAVEKVPGLLPGSSPRHLHRQVETQL